MLPKLPTLATKYRTILANAKIDTPLRLAHFFAQIHHESGLVPREENLNYAAKRLLQVFPKYFTPETAKIYSGRPDEIANIVYANRMGNGPATSGDGYRYRGRGFIQLTGKDNYSRLSADTGTDYLRNPDLLLNEADAMVSAIWFWTTRRVNHWADKDSTTMVTRTINGGTHGLQQRQALTVKYKSIFAAHTA